MKIVAMRGEPRLRRERTDNASIFKLGFLQASERSRTAPAGPFACTSLGLAFAGCIRAIMRGGAESMADGNQSQAQRRCAWPEAGLRQHAIEAPAAVTAFNPLSWRRRIAGDLTRIERRAAAAPPPPTDLTALEVMTIVLEDRRFFRHRGVDLQSVARELGRRLGGRRHGGASTIDMQLVRTVTGYRDKTLGRKLYEAMLAVLLQQRADKRAILWTYLTIAYFGTGLTGAEAAAQRVFGKGACDLDLKESAFLSAMLCIPRPRAAPDAWRARVERRAAYGLRMLEVNWRKLARCGVVVPH